VRFQFEYEIREDPAVFLDVPASFPHGEWPAKKPWIASAAAHAAAHAPELGRSERQWRRWASEALATPLHDVGATALFWAFGRDTDPVTIVQLQIGGRADGRPIAELARDEATPDAASGPEGEDRLDGEIDSAAHGRIAFAAGVQLQQVGRRTLRFPTYWVVAEPVEGTLITARHAILGDDISPTLLEQMIALVESTSVQVIPIEEVP
jgi:hypothetical protein